MRVLLIEPDFLQALIYEKAITREGHSVLHALSAQSAIHIADEHIPDVVVVEIQLPKHNGIEFLYEFRSYTDWMDIPVILHTFVPVRDLERLTTIQSLLGVKRVLYKPSTSLRSLCEAINLVATPMGL